MSKVKYLAYVVMCVYFIKNVVDRGWNFQYYKQKEYYKDDEWKSNYFPTIHSELGMV